MKEGLFFKLKTLRSHAIGFFYNSLQMLTTLQRLTTMLITN